MDIRVLLIGEEKSFMFNAIVNGLKREEMEVETSAPAVKVLGELSEDVPRVWILYVDGNLADISDTVVYLKDVMEEKEYYFYVIGSVEEIETLRKSMPGHVITESFERPLNVKELAAALEKTMEAGAEAEQKKKILIIDDNPTMLRTMKNLLSDKYRVYMANSGMNGITFLAKNPVDLILLDYEMPVISGAKVLEMIRSEAATSTIPVMMLTAKDDKESVMSVLALKPEKYLLKTQAPEELIRNIDEHFEKQKKRA